MGRGGWGKEEGKMVSGEERGRIDRRGKRKRGEERGRGREGEGKERGRERGREGKERGRIDKK